MKLKNKIIAALFTVGVLFNTPSSAQQQQPQVIQVQNLMLNSLNTLNIRGAISDSSVIEAQLKLANLVKKRGNKSYKIYVILDSPGGSIMAGEDFITFARTFQNVDTVSIFAASMASAIVQALPGKRLITTNGTQMFHRAKGGFQGQFEMGEVESVLDFAKALVRSMEIRSANRIGMDLETYKAKVKDEWWLYGVQNMVQKTADGMVQIICSQDLIDSRETMTSESFFGSRVLLFSGCPLLRDPLPSDKNKEDSEEE